MIEKINDRRTFFRFINDEEECAKFLEFARWKGNVTCIYCQHSKVYNYRSQKKHYRCAKCKKLFSLTKGTIFENSPIPLGMWYEIMYDYLLGATTSVKLSRHLNKKCTTTWFMHQRIMELFKVDFASKVPEIGTFEVDEAGFGMNESKMSKARRALKTKMGGYGHKTGILTFCNRGKELFGIVVPPYLGKAETQKIIKRYIHQSSTVYTDKSRAYSGLTKYFAGGKQFNHKINDYGGGSEHSNTVEGCFRGFRAMVSQHIHISPKYLQRYWDEYCFRYNLSKQNMTVGESFEAMFKNINRRISLKDLKEEGQAIKQILDDAKAEREAREEVKEKKKAERAAKKVAKMEKTLK